MDKVNSYLMEQTNTLLIMDIGERMRRERREKKISQDELARRVGVTQGLISQIENGTNDSSKYLTTIARELDVSPDWLETGRGEKKRREVVGPMSRAYPPELEETLATLRDPAGSGVVVVVFRDVNGTQVSIKLQDAAARMLAQKLAELGM
jgi:transcriptional regulator with XRE-family HTH domain